MYQQPSSSQAIMHKHMHDKTHLVRSYALCMAVQSVVDIDNATSFSIDVKTMMRASCIIAISPPMKPTMTLMAAGCLEHTACEH